jgi:hypothetical protein
MVQEPVAASSAAVVDLTSSQTPSEIASNGAKTGTGASVSQSKPGDPNGSTGEGSVTPGNVGVDESDEDGVDDVAIDGSLYEEILDEVEDFEYSKDGGFLPLPAIVSVDHQLTPSRERSMHRRRSTLD